MGLKQYIIFLSADIISHPVREILWEKLSLVSRSSKDTWDMRIFLRRTFYRNIKHVECIWHAAESRYAAFIGLDSEPREILLLC